MRSGEFKHPDWTVGSVDVLLAASSRKADAERLAGPIDGTTDRFTVKDAVGAWSERCDQRPEDVGLLYVAGHGTDPRGQRRALLLEGFGGKPGGMSHALDIEFLIRAMGTRRAHANFFFIDMCRNTIEELKLEQEGEYPVRGFSIDGREPVRQAVKVFFAAAPGDTAWTLEGEPELASYGTVFAKALFSSLRDPQAFEFDRHDRGGVTADRLHEAIAVAVESAREGAQLRLRAHDPDVDAGREHERGRPLSHARPGRHRDLRRDRPARACAPRQDGALPGSDPETVEEGV